MDLKCEICNSSFENLESFTNHLKTHSKSAKKYCEEYLNKKDPVSGSQIIFKSFEQYLLTDFESKTNMLAWLKLEKNGLSKFFIKDKIKKYSFLKSVSIFPSCSEIRTISYLPSIKTINYFYPDLNGFIDSVNLKRRFNYNLDELKLNFIFEKNTITVDTREQKPIFFAGIEVESKKLEFGDYSIDGILAVERKSLNDFVSTLSSGFERFNREILRAVQSGGYIVVVVDCDINKFLSFNYSSRVGRYAKASADFIFHRMRELSRTFPENLQFCFSGGRKESSDLIKFILSNSKESISGIDIQYCIEKKYIDLK
jgi:hypothetical protein